MYDQGHAAHSRTVGAVRPRASRHALAWLLLLCAVLLGIVAMHTLGHLVDHERGVLGVSASHVTAGHMVETPGSSAQRSFPTASSVAADRTASHAAGSDPRMLADPSDVCLAILIAVGVLITLCRMAVRIRAAQRNRTGMAHPFSRPPLRGPPGLGPPALRMVVLRI